MIKPLCYNGVDHTFLCRHWEVATHLVDLAEVECAHTDNARNLFLKIKVAINDKTKVTNTS